AMTMTRTLLAAAVLFALAACQPEPAGTVNAAPAGDPLLVQQDEQDPQDEDEEADQEDRDQQDEEDAEPEDADTVASSPAEATEQADEAADDALLDTRQGGNPLVDNPIAPVE